MLGNRNFSFPTKSKPQPPNPWCCPVLCSIWTRLFDQIYSAGFNSMEKIRCVWLFHLHRRPMSITDARRMRLHSGSSSGFRVFDSVQIGGTAESCVALGHGRLFDPPPPSVLAAARPATLSASLLIYSCQGQGMPMEMEVREFAPRLRSQNSGSLNFA